MREMIVNELTQATQELVREFARFLPRLLVMLIVVLVGWMIAYLVKWILRSILASHQVRQTFRRRRRHADYSTRPRCRHPPNWSAASPSGPHGWASFCWA